MIPNFPEFKNLTVGDKQAVEAFTHHHLPYSDFNFTNLFAWDVLETRKISNINGNLAVLFTDYRTNKPSLSFLGTRDAINTAQSLLYFSSALDVEPVLSFIPEETASTLIARDLKVEEDASNHDYIFSIPEIANPNCSLLSSKCRLIKHFERQYSDTEFIVQQLSNPARHHEIIDILHVWGENKKKQHKELEIEYEEIALKRLLTTAADHDLIFSHLRYEDKMIAFSIDEVLPNGFILSHFVKSNIDYKGVYEFLNQKVAIELLQRGGEYWNWEQDLNIEGLRKLKLSYHPVRFLKKYRVALVE